MRRIIIFFLFVIPLFGWCEEDLGESQDPFLLDGDMLPSAQVRGVNVITGTFTFDEALVGLDLPEPLVFGLSYNSRGEQGDSLGYGFSHHHPTELNRVRESDASYSQMIVDMPGGSRCHFYGKKGWLKTTYFLDPKMQKYGLINCGGGQTNYKNWQLVHEKWSSNDTPWILSSGDGTKRYYDEHKRLKVEERSSGNQIRYGYDLDHRLNQLMVRNRAGDSILGLLKIDQSKDRWTIKTSQKKSAQLTFEKKEDGSRRLRSYCSTGKVGVSIDYSHNKLTALKYWDGRGLFLKYGSKRVQTLSTFGRKDAIPTQLFTFDYHRDSRYTNVTDSLGMRRVYRYNKNQWLTSVERCWGETFYSSQNFIWRPATHSRKAVFDCSGGGNLLAKTVKNQQGEVVLAVAYAHDDAGNITQETVIGNLTGSETIAPIRVDSHHGYLGGGETFTRNFDYSQDGRNLLVEESDENGLTLRYRYHPETNRLAAQYTCCHDQIVKREFFRYDPLGFLVEKISDDGSTESMDDLTGVTERHIIRQTPLSSYTEPGFGKPQQVVTGYWDRVEQQFQQLNRVVNEYNDQGLLAIESVYDANDTFRYALNYAYDKWENVVMKSNPMGQCTHYKYKHKNCIYEEVEGTGVRKESVYDRENRCIAEKHIDSDGKVRLSLTFYHPLGQILRTVNVMGNATHYHYDPLGRCTEVVTPPLFSPDGEKQEVVNTLEYNCLDQVITEIDPLHNVIRKTYTARGQVTSLTTPDRSTERRYYSRDGSLVKQVSVDGSFVCFAYDVRRRPILEERFDASGEKIQTIEKEYQGDHLTSIHDSWGTTATYAYDGAGRLIEEIVHTQDGTQKKCFAYDALGQLHLSKVFFGATPDAYTATIEEHDLLGRVIESRIEDAEGNVLRRARFTYDLHGNLTEEKVAINEYEWSCTQTEYDAQKRPILLTDPEGNRTTKVYDDDYINAHGQNVLKMTTIHPTGRQTVEIFDTHGRVSARSDKDPFGSVLAHIDFTYDALGNQIVETHQVFAEGKKTTTYHLAWEYDACQRMVSVAEQGADQLSKKTCQEYDSYGRLSTIFKPDGTTLEHTYDARGQLLKLIASDQTIDYQYTYDLQGRLVTVDDAVQKSCLKREYDAFGQLLSEILPNALTIGYNYDLQGRTTKVHLPDQTAISYTYDALNLNGVSRLDANGSSLYQHCYAKTDLQGNTLVAVGIEGSHFCSSWDALGRRREFQTSYWSQCIPDEGFDSAGNVVCQEISDFKKVKEGYAYDALDRLTQERGLCTHTYAYDSIGNRLSKDGATYSVNGLHQVEHDGQASYHYDSQGNLQAQEGPDGALSYHYDALNRLTQVEGQEWTLNYTYDAFGRRLTRKVSGQQEEQVEAYLYQGEREIGSYSADGVQQSLRLLGRGKEAELGAAIAIEISDSLYMPLHNHKGDVCCLVDARSCEVVQWARYTAFGEVTLFDGEGSKATQALCPWLTASKRHDPLTHFVHFGHRDYAPHLGRFVTPDPAGFGDGPNLYQYSNNNPLIFVDPYGLWLSTLCRVFQGIRLAHTFLTGGMSEMIIAGAGLAIEQAARHTLPEQSKTRFGLEIIGSYLQGGEIPNFAGWIHPEGGILLGEQMQNAIVRVTTGILTDTNDCVAFAQEIQTLLGSNLEVRWTCNASKGFVNDILTTGCSMVGVDTKGSSGLVFHLLKDYWELQKRSSDPLIYLIAHSRGGAESSVACQWIADHHKNVASTIKLFTIGSAKLVRNHQLAEVINYVNDSDLIPRLDLINKFGSKIGQNVVYTGYKSQSLARGISDHLLSSDGYQQAMKKITAQILNEQRI